MSSSPASPRQDGRRTVVLAVILGVQSLATVFFIGDVIEDISEEEFGAYLFVEALTSFALAVGVVFGALEMRRTLERSRRAEAALSVASGAFAELIAAYFEQWKLTPAEADVALFALKGFDVAEIAELRGAAAGTVRAQLTRVYAKAGVSNRTQLLSLFTDDLLAGALPGVGGGASATGRS